MRWNELLLKRFILCALFVLLGINIGFAYPANLPAAKISNAKKLIFDPLLTPITAATMSCDNNVLVSTELVNAANSTDLVNFYFDENLTQQVPNATLDGVTYLVSQNGTTFSLQINNLNAAKTIYAARVTAQGTILTQMGDANFIALSPINVYKNAILNALQACGSVDLLSAIQVSDQLVSTSDVISIYDASNTLLTNSIVTQSGNYKIEIQSNRCIIDRQVEVTILDAPQLAIANKQVLLMSGQTHTIAATSANGATITVYDLRLGQNVGNTVGPFTTPGNYVYRVDATLGTCTVSEFVSITVDDVSMCKVANERVYASIATPKPFGIFGFVTNPNNAADANTESYATLTVAVGALGLVSSYIDLKFTDEVPKGKPIIIKLGTEYGGLDLLSGATLTTIIENNSGNKVTNGVPQSVNANLLGLLNGRNEYEVVFFPNPTNANSKVYGVRILITAALSVAQNLNVFKAFYYSDALVTNCDSQLVDVLSGTKGYGVNVANATVGVDNPRNFSDGDPNSFTQMYVGAGVLAEAYLTPVYSSYSSKDDVIEMVVSDPNGVLNVGLLNALTYRKFDRDVPVGPLSSVDTNVLSLTLLSGSTDKYVLKIQDSHTLGPWDRFELRLGAVANVLDFFNIYDIKRLPKVALSGIPVQDNYMFCIGQTLSVDPQDCTTFKWYSTPTGTTSLLSETNQWVVPANLTGNQVVYVQAIRNGCEVLDRYPITFTVGTTIPVQDLTINTTFNPPIECAGNVTLAASVSPTITLTNPYYQWYKLENGVQTLIPNESDNSLELTGLLPGNYTYFVAIGSDEYCLSAEADRKKVDFIVPRLTGSGDFTTSSTVAECNSLKVTTQALSSLTNVQYKWYFDDQGIREIIDGATDGPVTYRISGNTLTIEGLPVQQTALTYYATLSSDQTCINTKDLRKVDVLYQPLPPLAVLTPGDQIFCATSSATLADIRLNDVDIEWYDAAVGGNLLPPTTVLTTNTKYYAIRSSFKNCSAYNRLEVNVVLDVIPAPTLTANQSFCASSNAQIKDLQTNSYQIIWKDENNVVLSDNEVLQNGQKYFGFVFVNQGCESVTGTEVTVTLTPSVVTTQKEAIVACNSTANLAVLTAIYTGDWYSDAAKTILVGPADMLVDGQIYYAAELNSTTCEVTNFEVTIDVIPSAIAFIELSGATQFCVDKEYTFQATAGFNTYNWSVGNAQIIAGGKTTDSYVTVLWNSPAQQTIKLEVDNLACLQTNRAETTITITSCSLQANADLEVLLTVDQLEPNYFSEVTFTFKVNNKSQGKFTNVVIDALLSSGFEFVSFQTNSGTYDRYEWKIPEINVGDQLLLTIKAKVLEMGSHQQAARLVDSQPVDTYAVNNEAQVQLNPIKDDCLIVYNEVSPNGDGINENLVISCLDKHPNTQVSIYNRYGILVYKNNNYNNSFNGTANVSGTFSGNELPSGTYFYTITFANGETSQKSGWLYIMR